MSALITGVGTICAIGDDLDEMFESLCAGRTGIAEPKAFNPAFYRTHSAFEIDDRPEPGQDTTLRATNWLEYSVQAALDDAGLKPDLTDVPVLIGTTLRELRSVELAWRDKVDFDLSSLHFGTALRRRFGAQNTYTVANACSASLYALALGMDMLALDEADTVVVAGVDTISESTYGLLDRCYPQAPDLLRPFDRNRKGMLQGEGAAAVVLRKKATDPHAALRGVGVNCDGYHPSAPDKNSIVAAVHEAHRRADVAPSEVDLIVLHGTGTVLNDEAEALAMAEVFGRQPDGPLMTAIKCMTGHTAGASGLHSLLVAIESMRTGRVPAITTMDEPMPEVDGMRLVHPAPVTAEMTVAQVDSFGFGGLNAVAIVEKAA
jgi:3-oxoacyl-[acyl-carrier-protein] synthase II